MHLNELFSMFHRKTDPKVTMFGSVKLVNRLTMYDLKSIQDAFTVRTVYMYHGLRLLLDNKLQLI